MLTPQDLQEVSFEKAKIGGYVMKSVDELLEPLIDDYITLYKENAVLKSKMRLLVDRLEYYRGNEAKLKEAVEEAKQGRSSASDYAEFADPAQECGTERKPGSALAEEEERLRVIKQTTADFIAAVEAQIARQQRALDNLKSLKLPQPSSQSKGGNSRVNPASAPASSDDEDIVAQIASRITGDAPRSVDYSADTRVLPNLSGRAGVQSGNNFRPE